MTNPLSPEFHCLYSDNTQEFLNRGKCLYSKFSSFLDKDRPVIDLGCGDGCFLAYLKGMGFNDILGVESNDRLYEHCRKLNLPVEHSDILDYLKTNARKDAAYLYIDTVEHLSFDYNLEVLKRIPVSGSLIIQTPNTHSVRGHEFYLSLPSHVHAYCPWVLKKMLEQASYKIIAEGTSEGETGPCKRRSIRSFIIKHILGMDPSVFFEGANYYIVARRSG